MWCPCGGCWPLKLAPLVRQHNPYTTLPDDAPQSIERADAAKAPADVTTTDEAEEQCCEEQSIERAYAAMAPPDVTTTDEAEEQCCEEQSIERSYKRYQKKSAWAGDTEGLCG